MAVFNTWIWHTVLPVQCSCWFSPRSSLECLDKLPKKCFHAVDVPVRCLVHLHHILKCQTQAFHLWRDLPISSIDLPRRASMNMARLPASLFFPWGQHRNMWSCQINLTTLCHMCMLSTAYNGTPRAAGAALGIQPRPWYWPLRQVLDQCQNLIWGHNLLRFHVSPAVRFSLFQKVPVVDHHATWRTETPRRDISKPVDSPQDSTVTKVKVCCKQKRKRWSNNIWE